MPELQMECFKCKTIAVLAASPGFNVVCEKCQTYLHSCGNCRHYVQGQCNEPQAQATPDPGARNTCDWFMPKPVEKVGGSGAGAADARAKLAKLFGDAPAAPQKPRNPFGDQ